jgi:hypothetical protein
MKRFYSGLLIACLALIIFSCVKPEDPDTTAMIYGDWIVQRVFVNGELEQQPNPSVVSYISLSLEYDGSYKFVDRTGRISVGTWEVLSASNLVLTDEIGPVLTFEIVSIKTNELHMVNNLSTAAGELSLRYIMRRGTQNF